METGLGHSQQDKRTHITILVAYRLHWALDSRIQYIREDICRMQTLGFWTTRLSSRRYCEVHNLLFES